MVNNGVTRRAIVIPDQHAPLHDRRAISVVCQAIEIIKPDIFINLGDVSENAGASHWQWRKKKRPPLEYQLPQIQEDIKETNKLLDQIDASLNKAKVKDRRLIIGNHDTWLDFFVDEHPYIPEYGVVRAYRLKERGYKWYEDGSYFKIGKLYFTHGQHYGGIHHARNHLIRLGNNVMYGHWHDIQQSSVTHLDGPKQAWAIGCLKDMTDVKNRWLRGRRINWGHAFAIVDWYKGGKFSVTVINIIDGQAVVYGKLINGK